MIKRLKSKRTTALALAAGLLLTVGIHQNHPVNAQEFNSVQPLPNAKRQITITLDEGKRAVDALAILHARYKDKNFTKEKAGEGFAQAMQAFAASQDVQSELSKHGFSEHEKWSETLRSFVMAYAFEREVRKDRNLDSQLEKLKNDPQIPESLKQQMMAMIQSLIPPKQNREVVKKILADPGYKKKVEQIFEKN